MHNRLIRLACLAMAIAVALTTVGCARKAKTDDGGPTVQPVPTETVEPTSTDEPVGPAVSSGQITTPASGTSARTAVLKAVSRGLGVSGTLTVYQLFVQGTAAVGDVKTASGDRHFFAATGGPDAWKLAWSAPFGSSLASVEKLLGAAPEVSAELAAKIDFAKVVKKPVKAPTLSSFKSYALKSAQSMAAGSYDGTFTVMANIAQDDAGEWWGNAIAEPADESFEVIGIWGHYVGGKWTGEIADFSEEDADAEFFPEEVLSALRF
jgi:hypothetical protein